MTTSAKVSQVSRTTVIVPNPPGKVSQVSRISVVNPNIPAKVSQICRITIIQAPEQATLYCWARQTDFPDVAVSTPVLVSPPS
jgi:hypothetical protein